MNEIIVYRNPVEAAFWQSGLLFPLIVAMVVAVIVALALAWTLDYFRYRGKLAAPLFVIIPSIAATYTIWKLWI